MVQTSIMPVQVMILGNEIFQTKAFGGHGLCKQCSPLWSLPCSCPLVEILNWINSVFNREYLVLIYFWYKRNNSWKYLGEHFLKSHDLLKIRCEDHRLNPKNISQVLHYMFWAKTLQTQYNRLWFLQCSHVICVGNPSSQQREIFFLFKGDEGKAD